MQRAEDTASPVDVYTAVDDWRAVDTLPSARDVRIIPVCIAVVPVDVPARAITRRVPDALCADNDDVARRAVVRPPFVAARAVDVPVDVARRCDTPRVAERAFWAAVFDVGVVRADDVVAARALVFVAVARRGTTVRVDEFVVFVRVSTFICALAWDGLTPGFRFVRMVLFI